MTQFDDAAAEQMLLIVCGSATNAPTIADSGNFALSAPWAPDSVGDTLLLYTPDGTTWYGVGGSDN